MITLRNIDKHSIYKNNTENHILILSKQNFITLIVHEGLHVLCQDIIGWFQGIKYYYFNIE